MGYRLIALLFMVVVLFFSASFGQEVSTTAALQITSPAFQNNGSIPKQYTCDGKDINPPLGKVWGQIFIRDNWGLTT